MTASRRKTTSQTIAEMEDTTARINYMASQLDALEGDLEDLEKKTENLDLRTKNVPETRSQALENKEAIKEVDAKIHAGNEAFNEGLKSLEIFIRDKCMYKVVKLFNTVFGDTVADTKGLTKIVAEGTTEMHSRITEIDDKGKSAHKETNARIDKHDTLIVKGKVGYATLLLVIGGVMWMVKQGWLIPSLEVIK